MRPAFILTLAVLLAGFGSPSLAAHYHLVPGSFVPNKGPDGNSIFLDTDSGLILVDTGRHPAHRDKLLAYAKERGRPIRAIFNTHWHLDHTTGNSEIRAAYPEARVYGTSAIDGAVVGFFPASRKGAEEFLKSGEASAQQRRGDGARLLRDRPSRDPSRHRRGRHLADHGHRRPHARRSGV